MNDFYAFVKSLPQSILLWYGIFILIFTYYAFDGISKIIKSFRNKSPEKPEKNDSDENSTLKQ